MVQIRLYDASTGELAPIVRGDAIRVEIHTADLASQGLVDVASTRPFVLFSLLQRLLQSQGLPTKFLFGSPGAGEVLRELNESDIEPGEEEEEQGDGRCVDIRFGAAREGEEWAGGESAGRMTLNEALRIFGHRALAFYLMGTHYSHPLGEPLSGLRKASEHVQRLSDVLSRLRADEPSPDDMRHHVEAFREALANDLDTPGAFVALFEWVLEAERRDGEVGDEDLRFMLGLLELEDLGPRIEDLDVPGDVQIAEMSPQLDDLSAQLEDLSRQLEGLDEQPGEPGP
jgi:hypothetical protein